ncbi:MAG: hypothetical protein QXK07_05890, partial [Desulfurococcaceae archaeon]
LVEDFNIVKTRIDTSRIRVHREASREKQEESRQVPYSVRLIFNRALKICQDYGVLPAVIFLAHTLLGVRETGFLLYWRKEDAMFIKCEEKTGFCHYFYSPLIANYFALLGVHPGVLYSQTQNYQEAHRIAGEFVKNYYKTYPYARRLHYLLKEKGLVFYEDVEENGEHVLVLEIHYYSNGEVGLRVKDNKGEEVLFEENIKSEPPLRIEIRTAFHREHMYEPNEETYFHRTNIL